MRILLQFLRHLVFVETKLISMNDFKGRQFKGEIILWAVRWY